MLKNFFVLLLLLFSSCMSDNKSGGEASTQSASIVTSKAVQTEISNVTSQVQNEYQLNKEDLDQLKEVVSESEFPELFQMAQQ
jgi:hypothetical protein